MKIKEVKTSVLRLAYEESGPRNAQPILLLHGWPDSPRTWDKVLPHLHHAGYRTIAPYIRGYGPSRFRDPLLARKPRRTGQPVAFANDLIDLADRLKLSRFHFVGHDWGARTGYVLAALFAARLKSLTTISVPFSPGRMSPPKLPQARAFWYQWFLCTKPGEKKFREDPIAFSKTQWDTWSPTGWYTPGEFAETAKSWTGPDFEDVVLHSYRSRWGHADLDPRYEVHQARYEAVRALNVPTLLLHGEKDSCELVETTHGAGRHFAAPYARILLPGVGHFPQREAPEATAHAILRHIAANES